MLRQLKLMFDQLLTRFVPSFDNFALIEGTVRGRNSQYYYYIPDARLGGPPSHSAQIIHEVILRQFLHTVDWKSHAFSKKHLVNICIPGISEL